MSYRQGRFSKLGRVGAIIALVLIVSACSGGGPTGTNVDIASAIVYGRAVDSEGTPVSGLRVRARAYQETCGIGFGQGISPMSVTNAAGEYGVQVISGYFDEWQCVQILVAVEGDTNLVPVVADSARFRILGQPLPPDSTRIDILLTRGADH